MLDWMGYNDITKWVTWLLNPPKGLTGGDVPVDKGVRVESVPSWSQAQAIRKLTDAPCCGKSE